MGLTYKDSGVDVDGGNRFVQRIAPIVKKTFSNRVITGIGGFGALYDGSFPDMKEPVLVSGTDGVGTKLKIAQMMNKHDTIGIDAVAMCVNDIITSGARPLFFLDYLSCGKLREDVLVDIVKGLARGCSESGCSLVGGETAEHPSVMEAEDYDIAGFAVGVVDRQKIINGSTITPGDVIIGLPSSGIHSNGYSLVRKLFFDMMKLGVNDTLSGLTGTLGENLLVPTRLYPKAVIACLDRGLTLKGIVHITGGGFYENIPRILPEKCAATIERSSFTVPDIFTVIQKEGNVSEREMFTTFNMGVGLMIFISPDSANETINTLASTGEKPVIIGNVSIYKNEKVVIT
ncbi:MAG TPA: phosphoribosylformylglycinamidine cyclo-ligase [Spirochaetota bacterium]|nr:phosphoribosylformylglycinamidine cyclo-ligase [Spirochaetota bacterium]